jgi:hypothetical protein
VRERDKEGVRAVRGAAHRASAEAKERAAVAGVVHGVLGVLELLQPAGRPRRAVGEGEEEGRGVGARAAL